MPIKFSDHAKFQLKERRIPQKLVKHATENPSKILPSFKGRKLRQVNISGKILEVVTKTEGSRITVITAYYLEKNYENEI